MKYKISKILTAAILTGSLVISYGKVSASSLNVDKIKNVNNMKLVAVNPNNLENGKYTLGVQVLKEKSNEISMAGQFVNKIANLQVENGRKTLVLKMNRLDDMKNINVLVNGTDTKYTVQSGELKFKISDLKARILIQTNVVPMGNARVAFRISIQDNINKVSEDSSESTEHKSVTTSDVNSSQNKEGSKGDNSKELNNNEEELPQTGGPITQASLLVAGSITALSGILLKRKNKK